MCVSGADVCVYVCVCVHTHTHIHTHTHTHTHTDPTDPRFKAPKEWKPNKWRISKIPDPACKIDPMPENEFLKRFVREGEPPSYIK
jgi:hypothetical protein